LVAYGPRRRGAVHVDQLTEVLDPQPGQRRTVNLCVAPT
jgi:hypothetical protein